MTGGDKKRSNKDFDIPEPEREQTSGIPKIILAEKAYDVDDEAALADQYAATLNTDQKKVILFICLNYFSVFFYFKMVFNFFLFSLRYMMIY